MFSYLTAGFLARLEKNVVLRRKEKNSTNQNSTNQNSYDKVELCNDLHYTTDQNLSVELYSRSVSARVITWQGLEYPPNLRRMRVFSADTV
jgi:hypothetical protein